jgi:DNA adenine methylase
MKARPPLRYPGSKFRAFKYIKPFIDAVEHDEYREPFFGSGAVFFQKKSVEYNWLNDSDCELMNFYSVIQNNDLCQQLMNEVRLVKPSKEFFYELKDYKPRTPYNRAYKYFVINRTAYSGIMNLPNWGFHPIKSVQPEKWPERIYEASQKLQYTELTCVDFEIVLKTPPKGNQILFFLDPPYFKADQKRAYVNSFTYEDHIRLSNILKTLPHKFILTYDDVEEIRELYSWANIFPSEWMYHTANSTVTTRKKGKELIITNFDIKSSQD